MGVINPRGTKEGDKEKTTKFRLNSGLDNSGQIIELHSYIDANVDTCK